MLRHKDLLIRTSWLFKYGWSTRQYFLQFITLQQVIFWRHHCIATLFLLFKFVTRKTIESLVSKNQCVSGWHENVHRCHQRKYRHYAIQSGFNFQAVYVILKRVLQRKATEQYFSVYTIYYAVQVSNVESIDKMPHFVVGMNGYTDRRLAEVNK